MKSSSEAGRLAVRTLDLGPGAGGQKVTIRDLRNHGGRVLERVARGETLTVTRSGRAVAELRPLTARGLRAETLLPRWRVLPYVNPRSLRRDIDSILEGDA